MVHQVLFLQLERIKVFKKLRKYFALIPIMFALTLFISSCAANNESKNFQTLESIKITSQSQVDQNWDNFIKRNYIQTILKSIYKNNTNKQDEYIQSQKNLGQAYFQELKTKIRYSNNIIYPYFNKEEEKFQSNQAHYAALSGNNAIVDLYTKNWLFFLYHLDKFVFLQYTELQASDEASNDSIDEIETNNLIYDAFYSPADNQIIDFVVQKYYSEEIINPETNQIQKPYEIRIYLLTKDGRIMHFDISGDEANNSISQTSPPSLHSYLYSYPKLILSKDKLHDFDLKKYVEVAAEWDDENYSFSDIKKNLFTDEYGTKEFRYILISIKG